MDGPARRGFFRRLSKRAMECNGTTYVGTLEDDLGEIRFVFCDACRTIALDSWDARRRRRSRGITYLDPKTLGRS